MAKIHGVQVHGSLGLVIELNRARLLMKQDAEIAIAKLRNTNTRISESLFEEALRALE